MPRKRIGFRVDSSEQLGLGHLMRCLALADSMNRCDTFFWVNGFSSALKIMQDRRHCYTVPELDIQHEIDFVVSEITRNQIDVLVVDFLHYSEDYIERLKHSGVKLISFYEQKHSCAYSDLVINCNAFKDFGDHKCNTSDVNCLGPSYVILRETIRKLEPVNVSEEVKRVLISMGGSDPKGVTLKVARALKLLSNNMEIVVHMGPAFRYRAEFLDLFGRGYGSFVLKEDVPELAHLMVNSDIAVASGGNTMYELCYLGIPSIIIPQNEHQREFAIELDGKGVVRVLDLADNVQESTIKEAVEALCVSHELRTTMSEIARNTVDGSGIERIRTKISQLISD